MPARPAAVVAALRRERGQTTTEFMGMILVIAAMVGVIATSDIDGQIARNVSDQICRVLGDSCATKGDDSKVAKGRDGDRDGLSDREEKKRNTLPGRADTDGDGLIDGDEVRRGTNPLESDSDDDGVPDGREVKDKTDPRDASDGESRRIAGEPPRGSQGLERAAAGDEPLTVDEARRAQRFSDALDPGADDLNANGIPDPNEFEDPPPKDDGGGGFVPGFVHTGLDVAGLVPGLGEPFDLANCGLYGAESNELDAGLSCGSAVPIAGYGATGAKVAKRGKEAAEAGTKTAKVADDLPLGKLRYTGPSRWKSGAGLAYGPHPKHGNYVRHVLRHAERDYVREARGRAHSVFLGSRSDVLPTIDEAWIRRGRPARIEGNDAVYEVEMGRVVGTQGEQRLRVVVKRDTADIASAYPIK